MDWWFLIATVSLLLGILAGLALTILSLPGNWLMVLCVAVFAWFFPSGESAGIGWFTVFMVVLLALLGELAELVASAMGVKQAGGSRRSAALAMVGSLVGAVAGAIIGVPVPIVGSVIACVAGACLGALGGAMVGEQWKGKDLLDSWNTGKAAFLGRLLGTCAKVSMGMAIAGVTLVALVI